MLRDMRCVRLLVLPVRFAVTDADLALDMARDRRPGDVRPAGGLGHAFGAGYGVESAELDENHGETDTWMADDDSTKLMRMA